MVTTRTFLPYFSPKRAIAPISLAVSISVSIVLIAIASQIFSLTCCSIARNASGVTAWKWVKSKRRNSTSLRDPAWVAWFPRMLWRAAWSKWVAVWFFMTRWRRLVSIAKVYSWFKESGANTSTVWSGWPFGAFWTSVTFATTFPAASKIWPWSATCPPISA